MTHSSSQRGSAFFIILIAIAMFAALSYAVFKGGSDGTAALTKDQARLAAQEIIAYSDAMAKTIQTLKLRGCQETQFNFANTKWVTLNGTPIHAPGHNPTAAVGCSVFVVGEGNLPAQEFSKHALQNPSVATPTTTKAGSGRIIVAAIPGVGDPNARELVLRLANIKKEVCEEINRISGVANPDGLVPIKTGDMSLNYNGNLTGTMATLWTDPSGSFTGKSTFCTSNNPTSIYDQSFIRVLLSR